MSRLGKQILEIPDKVEVLISSGASGGLQDVTIKGPKGQLSKSFRGDVKISVEDKRVITNPVGDDKQFSAALWGTYASHLRNMIEGVVNGFEKVLTIQGVGYKVALQGDKLVFNLGFSHQIEVAVHSDVSVEVEKNVIKIRGIDKERVSSFAAKIVAYRKPEPYKGKGILYEGQVIRRKEGKKSVA